VLLIPVLALRIAQALRALTPLLRRGAYSLGASGAELTLYLLLPAASRGIVGAALLGFARAWGEGIVVALLMVETVPGHIIRLAGGNLAYDTPEYHGLFALGLVLFVVSSLVQEFGRRLVGWPGQGRVQW
jgi:phosphate transport system permease protein